MNFYRVNTKMDNKPNLSWSAEKRLAYIDLILKWKGRINRNDLMVHFNISTPQASLDITNYSSLAPNNICYDRKAKAYVRKNTFSSYFPETSSTDFFFNLLKSGQLLDDMPNLNFEEVPQLERVMDNDAILEKIVFAITNRLAVDIEYQSMTNPHPTTRTIRPTALVSDGSRWHVRAFCMSKNGFRDFMLARMLSVSDMRALTSPMPNDEFANSMVYLQIEADPKLTPSQKAVVEYDYGMENHILVKPCKKSHLFYMLRKYRFLNPKKTPTEQEIQLKNLDEIKTYLTDREIQILSETVK